MPIRRKRLFEGRRWIKQPYGGGYVRIRFSMSNMFYKVGKA